VGKFSEEPGHREGAGTIDYLIYTIFISRPGWLIYYFFISFKSMKNNNLFNRKGLKSFSSFLMNKASSAEAANQPPWPQTDFLTF
jgi:hypothetical protein